MYDGKRLNEDNYGIYKGTQSIYLNTRPDMVAY